MDRPGEKDCKIIDNGVWLSESIIDLMVDIYEKKRLYHNDNEAYYAGKRDIMLDIKRFCQE